MLTANSYITLISKNSIVQEKYKYSNRFLFNFNTALQIKIIYSHLFAEILNPGVIESNAIEAKASLMCLSTCDFFFLSLSLTFT